MTHEANDDDERNNRCSSGYCTNKAQQGGLCFRHGAKWAKKRCSNEECSISVAAGYSVSAVGTFETEAGYDQLEINGNEYDGGTKCYTIPLAEFFAVGTS